MTENESLTTTLQNAIDCATDDITREDLEMMVKCLEELQQYRAIGTVKELQFMKSVCDMSDDMLKSLADAVRARMEYEAIGSVEEFKALKEKEERFDRNIKMFNEIGLEIRAKAIDEFAEKLNTDVESLEAEVNGIRADLLTLDYFSEFVFDVAEQMKGEQNG